MRNNQSQSFLLGCPGCKQSLTEATDLISLDERGVDESLIGTASDSRVLGGDEIVTNNKDLLVERLHELLPTFVVVFGERVLEGDNGVLLHPTDVKIHHLVGAQDFGVLRAPKQVLADRFLLAGLLTIGVAEFAGRWIKGETNVPVGHEPTLLDSLYRHAKSTFLGEKVILLLSV